VASSRVVARSLASSAAARAIRSAAAAAMIMLAELRRWMCPIPGLVRREEVVWILSSAQSGEGKGGHELVALVRTCRTATPCPRSRRTSSRHL
jgi:hypothetical protein